MLGPHHAGTAKGEWLAGQLGASRISASGGGMLILCMQSSKQPLTYRPNHRRAHESWVMGKPGSPSLAVPFMQAIECYGPLREKVCVEARVKGSVMRRHRLCLCPRKGRRETEACSLPPVRSHHFNHIAVGQGVCVGVVLRVRTNAL